MNCKYGHREKLGVLCGLIKKNIYISGETLIHLQDMHVQHKNWSFQSLKSLRATKVGHFASLLLIQYILTDVKVSYPSIDVHLHMFPDVTDVKVRYPSIDVHLHVFPCETNIHLQ